MTAPPNLPQPGSTGFTPALVGALLAAPELRGWTFDATLVAVFLLALVARRGGVIVDVESRKKKSGVHKVSRSVVAILESIFGAETRTVHLHPNSSAGDVSLDASADAVVLVGLETAPPPVHVKLRSVIARAEKAPDGGPLVVWVRDESYSEHAAPWLLDLFACSTPVLADDLEPPPMGLTPSALLPPAYIADLRALLLLTHIHPPLEAYIANVVAALALHPNVDGYMSARGSAALTSLVRAQRLLAAPFPLPEGWDDSLAAWQSQHSVSGDRLSERPGGLEVRDGLGGGPGGVGTWAPKAGEVPTAESMLGPDAEDWFCLPENVSGVFELAVRHRVRARRPGQSSLYALNGSAQERVQYARREEPADAARKRRNEVDDALESVLLDV